MDIHGNAFPGLESVIVEPQAELKTSTSPRHGKRRIGADAGLNERCKHQRPTSSTDGKNTATTGDDHSQSSP
jgi:hypothetical protein